MAAVCYLFAVASLGCWVLIWRHAFMRSVGTGVMVLLLPVYNLYYAFGQFEHRRKGLVLAGAVGALVLAAALKPLSV